MVSGAWPRFIPPPPPHTHTPTHPPPLTRLQVEKTKLIKNNLNPVWNERLWLLVQEPLTQCLYVSVYDRDLVNLKVRG